MPPKAKITKAMILDTVLDITRETGFETVNARSIANHLQCSTRPIFTCYENMEELKKEFLIDYQTKADIKSYLILPLSYIEFAQKETYLFKLLFIDDMDLQMEETADFYNEVDNEKMAKRFSDDMGLEYEIGKTIFLDLFLYSHGIAVLTATKKMTLDRDSVEKMITNMLSAFIQDEKLS